MLAPVIAFVAIGAIVWPAYINHRTVQVEAAPVYAVAPVTRDYERRAKLVAFWEGAVRERHDNDMLSPRELAGQYMQRYREQGDIDDVVRAQHMAERSLHFMRSAAAIDELASVMLTLHRFREALSYINQLVAVDPHNAGYLAQKATLQMELGDYAGANTTLLGVPQADRQSVAVEASRSRYDELTGQLPTARTLLADASAQADAHVDEPAQSRAWYHVRSGELAFESGDNTAAIADERDALALFPTYNLALKDKAKFELANHDYAAALTDAQDGARVTPFAETLGYEADAQSALGQSRDARASRDVIFAIERIGNAYRVNDRLLAVYYADHHLRSADALAIARREIAVRGDEIYAQDTLAWAAAMDGRWTEAQKAAHRAVRLGTQDPIVNYHAGVIALHTSDRTDAARFFKMALDANPHFHPVFADAARRSLAALVSS